MADPFSIACGVAQFAGLAAQAADGLSSLRRRFVDIRGAPQLIRNLNRELQVLEDAFREISSVEQHIPDGSRSTFTEIVEQCADHATVLFTILMKYEIRKGDPKTKRIWKAIVASERRPELEELLRNIERAKTTVIAFLQALNVHVSRYSVHTPHHVFTDGMFTVRYGANCLLILMSYNRL